MARRWKMVIYRDGNGYSPYLDWVTNTLDRKQTTHLQVVLSDYLFKYGNSKPKAKWLRDLSGGLYQLRVQGINKHGEKEVLLRVYLHFLEDQKVLFLSGYDKLSDSSPSRQQEEIGFARSILKKWSEDE